MINIKNLNPTAGKILVVIMCAIIVVGWPLIHSHSRLDICTADQEMRIEQMMTAFALGSITVPKDYIIEQWPNEWTAARDTKLLRLPSDNAQVYKILSAGYRGTAICRVKDPNGKWWIATSRSRPGSLLYVASDDVAGQETH